jgi:hypothetical protein
MIHDRRTEMKFAKIAGVTAIIVLVLAFAGINLAFAQQPEPTDNSWINSMRSMMGGNWQQMAAMHNQAAQNGGMQAMHEWMHQSGGVHDTAWNALARQLGLTSEELTAQTNTGKTLAQIAAEKGVSAKELAATMETAMESGLAQAVKGGKLTQDQANLMIQHMDGQYEWMITNMGPGMMSNGNSMMSNGTGMMGNRSGMMGSGSGMMGNRSGMMGSSPNN